MLGGRESRWDALFVRMCMMKANSSQEQRRRATESATDSSSLHNGAGEGGARFGGVPLWGAIDYVEVRRRIGIVAVLELLEWPPVTRAGVQLRGPCPIHGSSSPHSRNLSVSTAKNAFKCFGCGCQGNQLDLFALARGLPIYRAAVELCERAGVELPRLSK